MDPKLGWLLLGSVPTPNLASFVFVLRNPHANSLVAQSTAEHFYCKGKVPGKEGSGRFKGQDSDSMIQGEGHEGEMR